jgi:ATPases involved in chromosome partitioning
MLVMAVANQERGVGKTTCCVNLSAELGRLGVRTLVVDADPQGNSSSALGIDRNALDCSVYDVIAGDTPASEAVRETPWENVFLLPATLDLAGAEVELAGAMSRESRLRRKMADLKGYDIVLIDCPPSLGLLTVNALVASDGIFVPVQCEYFALEGLGQLLRTMDLVRSYLREDLSLSGLVMTMFDSRTRLSREVVEEVRRQFGDLVLDTVIPRNVKLSEAPSFGRPIGYYDPASSGAEAFRELAKEVTRKWLDRKP